MMRGTVALIALGMLVGCGDDGGGETDAGRDASAVDAGTDGGLEAGTDAGRDEDGGADAGTDAGSSAGHYFPVGAFFLEDVSDAPAADNSDELIGSLEAAGGFGFGRLQIDFSIQVLHADESTPFRTFEPSSAFYSPDCDHVSMPVPIEGRIEGESGYACDGDGDCHLLVFAPFQNRLYEMWRANIVGETFEGGCLAVWDTSRVYAETGRGDQCTSADAAGFPIAPLLFTADEVAAGEINHAIRFILPNDRIRRLSMVRPATHGTRTSGGESAPSYGVHLRLRADYPLEDLPNEGARVVARALQRYGMYHADGGNIALTAQADTYSTAKWEDLLGSRDLDGIDMSDFEVIHHSDPIDVTFDCERTPLSE